MCERILFLFGSVRCTVVSNCGVAIAKEFIAYVARTNDEVDENSRTRKKLIVNDGTDGRKGEEKMRKFETVSRRYFYCGLTISAVVQQSVAIESEIDLNLESTHNDLLCSTRAMFSPMFSSTKNKNSLDAGH